MSHDWFQHESGATVHVTKRFGEYIGESKVLLQASTNRAAVNLPTDLLLVCT